MGRFEKRLITASLPLLLSVATMFLTACSSTDVDLSKEKDPEKLYEYGVKVLKDKDYLEAQDVFAEIKKVLGL
jgi:outer membrane protein assembly factor BamD (BamD/ComL family)